MKPAQRIDRPRRHRGALLLAVVGALVAATPVEARPAERPEPDARVLVIVLDAVPYDSVLGLAGSEGDAELLRDLRGPVPLVSTFPSSTSIALTAILSRFGLDDPPGYEAKFYDRELDKIRGGGLISYGKIRFDWHHFFDWQLRGFFSKSKVYTRPLEYNVKELRKALDAFARSRKRSFFVYVNSTDATGHIRGPEAFGTTFEALDRLIPQVREKIAEPLYVVLLSDHGLGGDGDILRNARPGVFRALREGGWEIRKHLARPGSVVLAPFGLVSSFEIYTRPGDEAAVAREVVEAPGVDLCAHPAGDGWVVVDREGLAAVERRHLGGTSRWAYRPRTGDPLGYRPLLDELGPGTEHDGLESRVWLERTWDAAYPDALYRIAAGFEWVENPASILCSVSDGYLYGSKSAYVGARLSIGRIRWTHGALSRDATLGFLMSDFPGWQPDGPRRFDSALDFLVDSGLDGSVPAGKTTPE